MTSEIFPQLTTSELDRFASDGYTIIPQLLDDHVHLEPIRHILTKGVDQQAQDWFKQGLVHNLCENESFAKRYGALRQQFPASFSNSWRRMLVSREIYSVWQYTPLLGIIRQFLGNELYASNIWNTRPRAPQQSVQTVDWHQDAQYMQHYDAVRDHAISVWIPLVPVDIQSGCLQLIPKSHKKGIRPEIRVERNNLIGLADTEVKGMETVSCIMQPGDVLLFSELLYHRALENQSDYTRWSLDIRYFDATNEALSAKEAERYRGRGYYCFSAANPQRVESYETWAATYEYDGEF